jgi:catecholate siderophore receptor
MLASKTCQSLISLTVLTAPVGPPLAAAEPEAAALQTIVVTAKRYYEAPIAASSKTDTLLRDVPQSISLITRQGIEDLAMQNIGDVVEFVPGVGMAQGEGNRETPVIRGSSSTGDFFLDGMRDDVQYYRDLYNIQQVEVLKGPNGMLFGRGGVGGLINRVTKQPDGQQVRTLSLQAGSYDDKRVALDVGQSLNDAVALRLNAMYEDGDSYRDDVTLERYGANPTMRIKIGDSTAATLGVEYFHDERVADRGVSSYFGRPLDIGRGTFIGDPFRSPTETTVKLADALIEHRFSDTTVLRNRTRYGDYDKFYQNVFAGAVNTTDVQGNPPGTLVSVSAYNNATERQNFFNQTDLNFSVQTGSVRHKFLTGLELGRQKTQNFRNTGYFDGIAVGITSTEVPLTNPRTSLPITWRQGVTDADNESTADIIGLYLQDEIAFSPRWQVIAGLRYDNFKIDLENHRDGTSPRSTDDLLSPRLALVYKPADPVSLYASYALTYQPRAGDQLSSLSATNASLDPEEFVNYEIGGKWDALAGLSLTAALFRLERSNVAITDPLAGTPGGPPAGTLILVDGQRNQGIELSATGSITDKWSVIGAFAYQDGEIATDQSATVLEGARLAALPERTFSLWNRLDLTPMWGFGIGLVYEDEIFAATENLAMPESNVVLPSSTRVDAAVFFTLNHRLRAQLNVQNVFDEDYYEFAHSNTNITPASPRAFLFNLTASF